MVNKVMLIGHLGRDPEVRYTQSGKSVANFSLATTERFKDSQGSPQERTEWHTIVAWGRLAEICGQYLVKGKQVYIEGRLQTREWDDRDGNKRRTTEVIASEMQMLGRKGDQPSAPRGQQPAAEPESEKMEPMKVGITDDDIPF